MTPVNVMGGALGDIFWDLPPWMTYAAGYDVGCSIHVANPTDAGKEYALMARLTSNQTVISEEALPVFGHTWFAVEPGDLVKLQGALRFAETDVDLAVLLIERETEEVVDSVATVLVSPAAGMLPPSWPGVPGMPETGLDWSPLLAMVLPIMMLGVMVPALKPRGEKREETTAALTQGRRLLPPGRGS